MIPEQNRPSSRDSVKSGVTSPFLSESSAGALGKGPHPQPADFAQVYVGFAHFTQVYVRFAIPGVGVREQSW